MSKHVVVAIIEKQGACEFVSAQGMSGKLRKGAHKQQKAKIDMRHCHAHIYNSSWLASPWYVHCALPNSLHRAGCICVFTLLLVPGMAFNTQLHWCTGPSMSCSLSTLQCCLQHVLHLQHAPRSLLIEQAYPLRLGRRVGSCIVGVWVIVQTAIRRVACSVEVGQRGTGQLLLPLGGLCIDVPHQCSIEAALDTLVRVGKHLQMTSRCRKLECCSIQMYGQHHACDYK